MLKQAPPIHLYLLSCLIFVLGGAIFVWTGWGLVTGLIYFAGIVSVLHLGLWDILEQVRQLWSEQNYSYDKIMRMDEVTRYQLGLAPVANSVRVTVDKTATEGNEISLSYRNLPVPAWKMKIIAQSSLNGVAFTIRQWAGPDAILSDPEWRELKNALLNLSFLKQKNPKNVNDGFEWTELGKQMLEQCVRDPLLSKDN